MTVWFSSFSPKQLYVAIPNQTPSNYQHLFFHYHSPNTSLTPKSFMLACSFHSYSSYSPAVHSVVLARDKSQSRTDSGPLFTWLFTYRSRGKGPEQIQDLWLYMFVPQAVPPTGQVSKVLNGFRTSVCTCLYHTHLHFFFVPCLLLCTLHDCFHLFSFTLIAFHISLQFAVANLIIA
jgi:hypothetical protein